MSNSKVIRDRIAISEGENAEGTIAIFTEGKGLNEFTITIAEVVKNEVLNCIAKSAPKVSSSEVIRISI